MIIYKTVGCGKTAPFLIDLMKYRKNHEKKKENAVFCSIYKYIG